jgi:ADP-dependent NAD(P)H-hydrate dehydratase / NAD(P)H-hydrate epimerase
MNTVDQLSVASGVSATALMDNAGRAVAQAIMTRYTAREVAVLCGPGNNGGDGFAAARHLRDAGWPVRVARLECAQKQPTAEAAHHAALWRGITLPFTPTALDGAALVVDALWGAGLNRALSSPAVALLSAAFSSGLPIVAVDVPSGVMGDCGLSMGAVQATITVTFFRKKPGHVLQPGRALCGEVVVADIGTPESVFEQVVPQVFENHPRLWAHALPALNPLGNKYTRGHALISGGHLSTGAARLSARAAARAGAGLTTIAAPEMAAAIYAATLTSVMVAPLSGASPASAAEAFDRLLSDVRFNALLIGPGAGVNPVTRARALAMLATGRPTVLDADALTVFEDDPSELFSAIVGPCVLTPHEGEFARIFKDGADPMSPLGHDKLTRARTAAQRSGAVVVLKGSDTVVAAPNAEALAIVNTNAPPTLATAGSGDVLAGFMLGLLAQGMAPFLAAAAAAWMHGAAAATFGPGLIAEDLPDLLPQVLRELSHHTQVV